MHPTKRRNRTPGEENRLAAKKQRRRKNLRSKQLEPRRDPFGSTTRRPDAITDTALRRRTWQANMPG
jgi:hypothetical protein